MSCRDCEYYFQFYGDDICAYENFYGVIDADKGCENFKESHKLHTNPARPSSALAQEEK